MKWLLIGALLFISKFFAIEAIAHGDHSHDHDQSQLALVAEITQKAIQLEAHIFPMGVAKLADPNSLQAEMMQAGTWQLISGLSRLYYRSLCEVCGEQPVSEEVFLQKLENTPAKIQAAQKLSRGLREKIFNSAVDITLASVDLGTRLGRTILLINVAWEITETAISVFTPLKGAHLFCTPVQIAMTLSARYSQINMRAFQFAPRFDESRTWMMIKRALISAHARSVFKKISLEMGPLEVDRELLEMIDSQGYQRGWGKFEKGNRERFIDWLDKKFKKKPDEALKVNVTRKEFLGQRHKKFLLLFSRKKNRNHLAAHDEPFSQVLQKEDLWVVSLQEGFLNSIHKETHESQALPLAQALPLGGETSNTQLNEVFESFLNEFQAEGHSLQSVTGLRWILKDIEFIFDDSKKKSSRYLRATLLESFFVSFIYRMMLLQWNEHNHDIESISELIQEASNRYAKGQFARISTEFSDFLRVAAMASDPQERKDLLYQSGYFLTRIFDYLQEIPKDSMSSTERAALNERTKKLELEAPWISRATSKSTGWWPLNWAPRCENL